MGPVSDVSVIPLGDVDPIELPGGSWSRMLVTGARVPGTVSSIGASVFTPGTALPAVCHETEEVAYVVSGTGELRLDERVVEFGQQARIVPRMQTDRGLVQDIQHTAQATAELAGQTNALCLAVRERCRSASNRQILQAHIVQKRHAANNLANQLASDLAIALGQFPVVNNSL